MAAARDRAIATLRSLLAHEHNARGNDSPDRRTVDATEPNPEDLVPSAAVLVKELPCWETQSGAWAVVPQQWAVCPLKNDSWSQWVGHTQNTLAHVDGGSCAVTPSSLRWPTQENFEWSTRFESHPLACEPHLTGHDGLPDPHLTEPELFDYDGDGEPEIWTLEIAEGAIAVGHLLTFRGGRVESFLRSGPDSAILDRRQDIDGDGRPDLIWHYDLPLADDCSDHGSEVQGPHFVAHASKAGGFAFDDPLARQYVRDWCPTLPDRIESVTAVLCARLLGATSASLLEQLAGIAPTDCDALGSNHPLSHQAPAMREAAKLTLPFQLVAP
jgi:hypothetical protein